MKPFLYALAAIILLVILWQITKVIWALLPALLILAAIYVDFKHFSPNKGNSEGS
jgi:4-hydroxybenzoate polyprenyltransferase